MAQSSRAKRKRKRRESAASGAPSVGGASVGGASAAGSPATEVATPRASARAVAAVGPIVDLAVERRRALIAGVIALLAAVISLAAVVVAAHGPQPHAPSGSNEQLLLDIGVRGSTQAAVAWIRVAEILILIPVAVFLYQAIRGRNPAHARWIPIVGLIGFVVFAVSLPWVYYEIRDVARVFVNSGTRTVGRADRLVTAQRDKGPLRVAEICRLIGAVMFAVWISFTSWEAQKVGLLTRFLAFFGIAAGVLSGIGVSVGQDLFIAWIACVGLLAVGYWPGGRPPAWDAGRAVSWDEADTSSGPVRGARVGRER